jgi:hypothetical protein
MVAHRVEWLSVTVNVHASEEETDFNGGCIGAV